MRILAVNQFYYPDLAATSQLLTQLCEDLVARGDDVRVLASSGSYLGGGSLAPRETVAGVDITRVAATTFGKGSIAARLSDYLSFWTTAVARAARMDRPDVIVTLTTPPMIATGVGLVAAARDIPMVVWLQDVYPELAVAFGVLGEQSPLAYGLRALMRATHRLSRFTVVLSDGMADRIEHQGQARERIRVIHNWADGRALTPQTSRFRREHDLVDRFVVMYSGNLGLGHEIKTLIDAARQLAHITFVFIGEGNRRAEAEREARDLTNVRFFPYQRQQDLADSLSAADVHLISLREGLEGLLVPSKLYGVLAVGRPIIFVGPSNCEVANVVRTHDIGWVVPSDAGALARVIAEAASDREATRTRGARARRVLDEHYDRPLAVSRWRALLHEALDVRVP